MIEWNPISDALKSMLIKEGDVSVLLYRPPAEVGEHHTIVAGVWIHDDEDGEPIRRWVWPEDNYDAYRAEEIKELYEVGHCYEADNFTHFAWLGERPKLRG